MLGFDGTKELMAICAHEYLEPLHWLSMPVFGSSVESICRTWVLRVYLLKGLVAPRP